jgi:hypothetical protein
MSTGDKARSGRRTEIAQRGTIVKKEEAPTGGRGLFEFLWGGTMQWEFTGRARPAPTCYSDAPDGKNSTGLTPLSPAAIDNRPAKVFDYRFCCVKLCLRPFVRSGKSVAHA